MKPFDIEAAKAGAPVITREGRKFTFGAYNPDATIGQQIVGWIAGVLQSYFPDGRMISDRDCEYDLFMATVKHRRAVFTNSEGIVIDYRPDGETPPSNEFKRAIIEWEE